MKGGERGEPTPAPPKIKSWTLVFARGTRTAACPRCSCSQVSGRHVWVWGRGVKREVSRDSCCSHEEKEVCLQGSALSWEGTTHLGAESLIAIFLR